MRCNTAGLTSDRTRPTHHAPSCPSPQYTVTIKLCPRAFLQTTDSGNHAAFKLLWHSTDIKDASSTRLHEPMNLRSRQYEQTCRTLACYTHVRPLTALLLSYATHCSSPMKGSRDGSAVWCTHRSCSYVCREPSDSQIRLDLFRESIRWCEPKSTEFRFVRCPLASSFNPNSYSMLYNV